MSSKKLEVVLLLITLLTKPRSVILSGATLLVFSVMMFFYKGQSIFFMHWQDILTGLLDPDVPLEQKVMIVSFFFLFTGFTMFYTSIFRKLVIEKYKRFGTD